MPFPTSYLQLALVHAHNSRVKKDFGPEIAAVLKRNSYVDDYLKSVESRRTAISHVKDLTILLKKDGFHLTKWLSNSCELMESIPTSERH